MQYSLNLSNSPRENYVFFHFADGENKAEKVTCMNKTTQLETVVLGSEPDLPIPELDSRLNS